MTHNTGRALRVLLIEDNKDDEVLVVRELNRSGYKTACLRVETESDLQIAIDEEAWDVVICDYRMPHLSALKALDVIRTRLGAMPFIVLSGSADEDIALMMLKAGAHDYIAKDNLRRLPLAVKREIQHAGDRMMDRLKVEKSYILTVEAWGKAMEMRDEYTKDHTIRVTDLTLRLARARRVSRAEFTNIRYGALLHDVGKMRIPDAVLLKPGPLDSDERRIMEMHPTIAFEMLSHIEFLSDAIHIPYCHHEKWDGTGYPRGLEGEGIPYEARIFSIADVYDALTTDRPYRKSWEPERALKHIASEAGKAFDPLLVETFLEMMEQNGFGGNHERKSK